MDDSLERPTTALAMPIDPEDGEQDSGDEDGGPDWTNFPSGANVNTARPIIPKRGEKDFEPAPGSQTGSGLQAYTLDRARVAMFNALNIPRTSSSKNISYAVWLPGIARARVTVARGIHFTAMGHSIARPTSSSDGLSSQKTQKRLELLPEEALYLVERGTLFCWKQNELLEPMSELEGVEGTPMSIQQAFAEMIGREDLTLEKYQVFAYLRRLGYFVTRARPPSPSYPVPVPFDSQGRQTSFLSRLYSTLSNALSYLRKLFSPRQNWWKPLTTNGWLHHNMDYPSIFRSLRIIPTGHPTSLVPTSISSTETEKESPYGIFYNLYKPSTPFRKTSPPSPDFSVVVIDTRTTPMPSLHELSSLFDVLPELPPPLPRQRPPNSSTSAKSAPSIAPSKPTRTFLQRIFWFTPAPPPSPPRKINPFMAIKAGKKNVVIAAVDSGSISFFRFGQGAFAEWPMI